MKHDAYEVKKAIVLIWIAMDLDRRDLLLPCGCPQPSKGRSSGKVYREKDVNQLMTDS